MADSWNDNKTGWGGTLNKGFTDRLLKRIEEEEEEKENARIQQEAKDNATKNAKKEEDSKINLKNTVKGVSKIGEGIGEAFTGAFSKTVGGLGGLAGGLYDKATGKDVKLGDAINQGVKDVEASMGIKGGVNAVNRMKGDDITNKDNYMDEEEATAYDAERDKDARFKTGEVVGTGLVMAAEMNPLTKAAGLAGKAAEVGGGLNKLRQTGKAGQVTAGTTKLLAEGAAGSAAGAALDVKGYSENLAANAGIDAALSVAPAAIGNGLKALRNAKNSTELSGLLKNTENLDISDEAKSSLDELSKSGLTGKQFKAQSDAILTAEKTRLDEQAELLARDAEELQANPLRDTPDEQLQAAIDDFNNPVEGATRTPEDYKAYQSILDEQQRRGKEAYIANGGRTVDEIEGDLVAIDNGEIPETAYKPAAPVNSMEELLSRKDVPVEIRNAADEVYQDSLMVNQQLENLMSPQVKEREIMRLDESYDENIKELQQRYASLEQPTRGKDTTVDQTIDGQRLSGDYKSDIRFQLAKEKLDNEYRDSIAELDMLEAQDMEEVDKLLDIQNSLNMREAQIVLDSRDMMRANPDKFMDVDDIEVEATRERLTQELEQAKKFNHSEAEIKRVAESQDPVATYEKSPEAQESMKAEVAESVTKLPESFKNLGDLSLAAIRMMSPSQVLRKMGLRGDSGIDLHTPIIRAEAAMNQSNLEGSKVLSEISKHVNRDPRVMDQIIDFVEGKRTTLSSVDDRKAAEMIQKYYKDKEPMVKEIAFREKTWELEAKNAELPEGKRLSADEIKVKAQEAADKSTISNYFTRIIDKDETTTRLFNEGSGKSEITMGSLKHRTGEGEGRSSDIMAVLVNYEGALNRKYHLEPALKPLDDIKVQLKQDSMEYKWFGDYINQLKGIDASKVGDAYNTAMDGAFRKVGLSGQVGRNHYSNTLGTQRAISAFATMGLNVGSALRNVTQMVNTVAELGPLRAGIGVINGTKMWATPAGRAELKRMGIVDGGVAQNFKDAIEAPGIRGRAHKASEAATKTLMSLMRGTDIMLRSQAYAGAKSLGKTKGLTGEALEDFAARKVVDTQFMTSRIDMPLAFNGQGVRSLTQLATFSGKQAGFLARAGMKMVKNPETGNWHMDAKAMGNMLAAAATAYGMTEVLKPVMGFRETEWIPFYDQVAPVYGAITGQEVQGGDGLYRSPLVQVLFGDGKSKAGLLQALQGQDTDGDDVKTMGEGFEKFFNDAWPSIVPAGAQIKKTTEGYNTTETGVSRNKSGNIRYLQDMDGDSQLQASLFGQYSTEAGRNWVQEDFPTLTSKQTQKVDEQNSRQAQEQFAGYYSAMKQAPGRQKAFDAAKEAAASGDQNKAAELIDEYNAGVAAALERYYEGQDELPKELEEEYNKRFITIKKVNDSLE